MSGFDIDSARVAYSEKCTDELIKIAFFEDEYLEEAIDLARDILRQRGINDQNDDRVANVEKIVQEESAKLERDANEPLHWGWRLYCFLIADIVAIIVILVESSSGRKRASKGALKLFLLGWLFRVVLIGVILLVERNSA